MYFNQIFLILDVKRAKLNKFLSGNGLPVFPVNGDAEHLDFLDSSLAEGGEEQEQEEATPFRSLGASYLAGVSDALIFSFVNLLPFQSSCSRKN